MKSPFVLAAALLSATPALAASEALGTFFEWGAFRAAGPDRCYAIAEPYRSPRPEEIKPHASIGSWPARGVRGQLHVRLSREKRPESAILLRIDDRTWQLVGGGRDAWAPDRAADAAIVAAMRTGVEMTIETRSTAGALIRDHYRLRGAATAIDAAAIDCGGRRR